jgi:tetratricopeptide (TPR) repeat protein
MGPAHSRARNAGAQDRPPRQQGAARPLLPLAKAADKLGEQEKALKCYRQAYELDPTHLPTLVDRADLLYRRQQWDDAFKLYQTVMVQHRESQTDAQIVEIFHRIGTIKMKVGERAKSINMFEKALEINPGHRPTLEALAAVHAEAGEWEAVIKQKRALLTHSESAEEKLRFHEEIIAIYKDKLANQQKAIAAYLEALEVKPDARNLLVDVLELLHETKQWKKAVEILMRLANLETGKGKAKYLETAGIITNVELHSPDEAVEMFNQALDEYPDSLKPFERIDKIMTAKKDWTNQQRNYRKMIKRLGQDVSTPEKKATQLALWQGLGEIYRSRLKMYREAAEAFEVCVHLEPDNVPRHQILAELFQVQGPECYDKAIREYRLLISRAKDPKDMVSSLKILRRLYAELGKYDHVWCVASTLAYLKQADAEEMRFFEQYRSKGLARVKSRLTEENWQKHIFHPTEDRYVSAVLANISQTVIAVRAQEHKDYGVKRKDRRDLGSDQLMLSRVFVYASQILGGQHPRTLSAAGLGRRYGVCQCARQAAALSGAHRRVGASAGQAGEGSRLCPWQAPDPPACRPRYALATHCSTGIRAQGILLGCPQACAVQCACEGRYGAACGRTCGAVCAGSCHRNTWNNWQRSFACSWRARQKWTCASGRWQSITPQRAPDSCCAMILRLPRSKCWPNPSPWAV